MRFIARAILPFGIAYLAVAIIYFGYYATTGQFGPFQAVYALFAGGTALSLIVIGRNFRSDPRYR